MPVGHGKNDVWRVMARECEVDDLLERHRSGAHRSGPRVHDDLERRCGRDEALDAGLRQIDKLAGLDEPILASGRLEEHGHAVARLGEAIEHRTADQRLAPTQFVVVEGQFEVAIRQKRDEPLGTAFAEVEGLVQENVFEVARG